MPEGPHADPVADGLRIVDAARSAGITLRLIGGVAVAVMCPSAASGGPLSRTYADVDVVSRREDRGRIEVLMAQLGYSADTTGNILHGRQRLIFWDGTNGRQVDVFVDRLEMCHTLELADRLDQPGPALPLADLLLAKLQVHETNERDYIDIAALLVDNALGPSQAIDSDRIATLIGADWGLWRTTTEVAERTRDHRFSWGSGPSPGQYVLAEQIDSLLALARETPKSRKWRMRARVGERVRWYELPEDMPSEQKELG